MSQVSLGRPEFVPGTPPGHPDGQIPSFDFSLSVFSLHIEGPPRQKFYTKPLFYTAATPSRLFSGVVGGGR